MTTYRLIASTETDPQAPYTSALAKAQDLNSRAIAEGDLTAPVNRACWHPYDMVFANDGAIGRFYNGTVVASVTTPTMEVGYDYMFRGVGVSPTINAQLRINGVVFHFGTVTAGIGLNFWFTLLAPAQTDIPKAPVDGLYNLTANDRMLDLAYFTNNATALTSFAFSFSTGNLDAGQLFMYRRRNYMP